jgi:hypothetical protein
MTGQDFLIVRVRSRFKMFDSMQPRPVSGPPLNRPAMEERRPNTIWPQRDYTPEFNYARGCWNYPIFERVEWNGCCRFFDQQGIPLPIHAPHRVETVRYVSWRVAVDHTYKEHIALWSQRPRLALTIPYDRQVESWEVDDFEAAQREGREFPGPEMYFRIDDDPSERARSRSRARRHPRTDAASSRSSTAQTTDAASGTAQTTGAASGTAQTTDAASGMTTGASSSTAQATGASGGTAQREQTDDWLAILNSGNDDDEAV